MFMWLGSLRIWWYKTVRELYNIVKWEVDRKQSVLLLEGIIERPTGKAGMLLRPHNTIPLSLSECRTVGVTTVPFISLGPFHFQDQETLSSASHHETIAHGKYA